MAPLSEFDAGRLTEQISQLQRSVEQLANKVSSLEEQASFGKGAFWGVLLVAGSLGAITLWAFQKVFGVH